MRAEEVKGMVYGSMTKSEANLFPLGRISTATARRVPRTEDRTAVKKEKMSVFSTTNPTGTNLNTEKAEEMFTPSIRKAPKKGIIPKAKM
jgi:hypothetical protein